MVSDHLPSFLSMDPDARGLLQWHVMVRTGDTAHSYEWRQGCVYSLAPPVILIDGSDAQPSSTDPNVVVTFESGRESLSLRLENFGDGDEHDSLCWFRIEEVRTLRRQRARVATRACASFETRSRRRRQTERGCGQCGFRAAMRQILAKRGIRLTKHATAVNLAQIKECRQIIGQSLIDNAARLASIYNGHRHECSEAQLTVMGKTMMAADPGELCSRQRQQKPFHQPHAPRTMLPHATSRCRTLPHTPPFATPRQLTLLHTNPIANRSHRAVPSQSRSMVWWA